MVRSLVVVALTAGCDAAFSADPPVPPDAPAALCASDNFDDDSLDPLRWQLLDSDNTPTTIVERNQQLVVSLAPSSGNAWVGNWIASREHDLTNGHVDVELVQPVLSGGTECFIALLGDSSVTLNQYAINVGGGGSLAFAMWVQNERQLTYRPWTVDDRWWRIAHDGTRNAVDMLVSADRTSWKLEHTFPATIPMDRLMILLGGATFQVNPQSPGAAIFDNVTVAANACPTPSDR